MNNRGAGLGLHSSRYYEIANGDVFVTDWRNDRIQKFSPDGKFLMKFGSSRRGDGEFNHPTGVAVEKDGPST